MKTYKEILESETIKHSKNPKSAKEWEEGYKAGKKGVKPIPDGKSLAWKEGWEDAVYPSAKRNSNPYT
jgi:hypothetical protein